MLGKSVLVDRLTKDWRGDRPDPEDAWRLLKRFDPGKPKELDLQRVAQRIASGYVPDELCDPGQRVLVVSTVHRAKGLEFDRVIIADPWRHDPGNEAAAEEARVLFVALTRSRRDYLRVPSPNISMMTTRPATGDRWVLRGPKAWMTFGFEVRGNDGHRLDPAGRFVVEDADPVSVQARLRDIVRAGDPLTLERHRVAVDGGATRIFYRIQHSCGMVGITSEEFGALMYRLLRRGAGSVSFPHGSKGYESRGSTLSPGPRRRPSGRASGHRGPGCEFGCPAWASSSGGTGPMKFTEEYDFRAALVALLEQDLVGPVDRGRGDRRRADHSATRQGSCSRRTPDT